jgi:hypothetical protein
MKLSSICLFVIILLVPMNAVTEENGPIIIPEKLQLIAADPKFGLAERLGIKWDAATIQDTGRYLGLIAAASELAISISNKAGHKEVDENDFAAALSILCLFPPNKPPIVEQYWGNIMPAYFNQGIRSVLDKAVGPAAVELTNAYKAGESGEGVYAKYSPDEAGYSANFLDLNRLGELQ